MTFTPGVSGNKSGRPRKAKEDWRKLLEKALTKKTGDQASVLERAIKGLEEAIDNEKGWLKQDACKYVIEQCAGKAGMSTTKQVVGSVSWSELVGKAKNGLKVTKKITGPIAEEDHGTEIRGREDDGPDTEITEGPDMVLQGDLRDSDPDLEGAPGGPAGGS